MSPCQYNKFKKQIQENANQLVASLITSYNDAMFKSDTIHKDVTNLKKQISRMHQEEEEVTTLHSSPQNLKEEEETTTVNPLSSILKIACTANGAYFNWFEAVWKYSASQGRFEHFWDFLFNVEANEAEAMSYIQNCLLENSTKFYTICKWARSQIVNFNLTPEMKQSAEQFCSLVCDVINAGHSSSYY